MLVKVADLVKVYPDGTRAVDGVSFEVPEGSTFGLLGPNGAGKTTTLSILTTLIRKTSGVVSVAGYDLDKNPTAIRRCIGYALQGTPGVITLDVGFTVRENLWLQAELQGISAHQIGGRVEEAAEALGLAGIIDKKVRSLSGGLARRVEIALALVHRPVLLFLDEPTTGLDPHSRKGLWNYLEKAKRSGTTILLTTQNMEEADKLADRIAIVHEGRVAASGTPAGLKSEVEGDTVTVTLPDNVSQDTVRKAGEILGLFSQTLSQSNHSITLTVRNAGEILSHIVLRLHEARVPIANLGYSQPSLDDVFLRKTGRRMRVS